MPPAIADSRLQHELRRRASRIQRSELAARMGYSRVDEKLLARIDSVLGDDLLGLDAAGFDFRYSRNEFLVALGNALGIDPALRDAEMARIRAIVSHRTTAFRPRIFVDTGFKRTTEPIFVLAFMEGKRWLGFERAFVDLDLAAQIESARERVVEHHRETGGELSVWGTIQRYLFQYGEQAVLVFDTAGRAVAETDAIRADRATLSVDGRDLSGTIPSSNADEDDR